MKKQNPFKLIGQPQQEAPKELKHKIMGNVSTIKLLMEMTSLLKKNYKKTIATLFKTKTKKSL